MRPSTRLLSLCLIASAGLGTGQPLAGTLLHAGRSVVADTARATALYERACAGDVMGGCLRLGHATYAGKP